MIETVECSNLANCPFNFMCANPEGKNKICTIGETDAYLNFKTRHLNFGRKNKSSIQITDGWFTLGSLDAGLFTIIRKKS
jgi:hypothetical protein